MSIDITKIKNVKNVTVTKLITATTQFSATQFITVPFVPDFVVISTVTYINSGSALCTVTSSLVQNDPCGTIAYFNSQTSTIHKLGNAVNGNYEFYFKPVNSADTLTVNDVIAINLSFIQLQ